MANIYELAEFLISSWKIATKDRRMPTSHGILDAALYRVAERLPPKFRGALNFGNTRVGFRCYELPQMLYCAQANMLTSEPNPTYLTTEVQISDETAYLLLYRLGIDPDEAVAFGKALSEVVGQVATDAESHNSEVAA